jgi:hypothetical protein
MSSGLSVVRTWWQYAFFSDEQAEPLHWIGHVVDMTLRSNLSACRQYKRKIGRYITQIYGVST